MDTRQHTLTIILQQMENKIKKEKKVSTRKHMKLQYLYMIFLLGVQ